MNLIKRIHCLITGHKFVEVGSTCTTKKLYNLWRYGYDRQAICTHCGKRVQFRPPKLSDILFPHPF